MLFTSDTFDNYLNGPLVVACTLTQAGKSIHTSVGIHVCVCVCVTQHWSQAAEPANFTELEDSAISPQQLLL